jgi:hypothetical protein
VKDAKGHGSDPRGGNGSHSDGVNKVGQPTAFRSATPQEFLAARDSSNRAEMFTPHTPEEIAGYNLFMNNEGTVGAAVTPKGDIQSVFNNSGVKGAGGAAIEEAKNRGGSTLDAFGEPLANIYKSHGFVETGRAKFDPAQAPPKWDTKKNGTPDVVFMKLKGK